MFARIRRATHFAEGGPRYLAAQLACWRPSVPDAGHNPYSSLR